MRSHCLRSQTCLREASRSLSLIGALITKPFRNITSNSRIARQPAWRAFVEMASTRTSLWAPISRQAGRVGERDEGQPWSRELSFGWVSRHLTKVSLREPLETPRHIRLLKLYPPAWLPERLGEILRHEQDLCVRCDVFRASLDDLKTHGRPSFTALSYTWGCLTTPRVLHLR